MFVPGATVSVTHQRDPPPPPPVRVVPPEGPLGAPTVEACCSTLKFAPLAFGLLGHIRMVVSIRGMRCCAIWQSCVSMTWTKSRNARRRSSNMTTPEMTLLCSSLQGVGTCVALCSVLGFATFAAFGKLAPPPPLCVHLDAPGQRHGKRPVSGTAEPQSSQMGQGIWGLR